MEIMTQVFDNEASRSDPFSRNGLKLDSLALFRQGIRKEFPFTVQKLLAYGPEVKVVSPRELQESVRELLEKTISQYS